MTADWTIGRLPKWTKEYLAGKSIPSARLDAEVLLAHVLGCDRLYLYVHYDQPLVPPELAAFRTAVRRRAAREPVAYITGEKEFMGLAMTVSPAVLIPRPDTEILVEAVLKRLKGREKPAIADIGTGSGAIIVSLLHRLAGAAGVGTDISREALKIAGANAARHGVAERLLLLEGDLYAPLAGRRFDAVVSNPPYIPEEEISRLAPEVRCEPLAALAGGRDGLAFLRRLVSGAAQHLCPGGFLAVEVGAGQAGRVQALAGRGTGLAVDEVVKDYGGIERVVIFRDH